ncbi:MAG: Hpt domain-containing protein [Sinobacterium sp.]|nr:Hpt domain-containing protein [Sinobacterium sp.]
MSMIDQQHALDLLGGNERIYLKFLQKFVDSANKGKYTISKDIVEEDFEHAARTFHAMKGLSENIGALSIKGISLTLDEAAKNQNKALVLANIDEYNSILEQVKQEAERILH